MTALTLNQFEGTLTAEQAIQKAGLNYQVESHPVFTQLPSEEMIPVPKHVATMRMDTNTPLGIVGKRYSILQNSEAFSFFDSIADGRSFRYVNAGQVRGGARVWLLVQAADIFEVLPTDTLRKHILFTNSHDGGNAVEATFLTIRGVCSNVLTGAINGRRSSQTISLRHTGDIASKVYEAGRVMSQATAYFDTLQAALQGFAQLRLDDRKMRKYIRNVFNAAEDDNEVSTRKANQMDKVQGLLDNGMGSDIRGVRGTLWGAYNAVTEFADHFMAARREDQTESILFGGARKLKQVAFQEAMALLK